MLTPAMAHIVAWGALLGGPATICTIHYMRYAKRRDAEGAALGAQLQAMRRPQ